MAGKNHFYSVNVNQETDQTRWNHFKRLTSSFRKEKTYQKFLNLACRSLKILPLRLLQIAAVNLGPCHALSCKKTMPQAVYLGKPPWKARLNFALDILKETELL